MEPGKKIVRKFGKQLRKLRLEQGLTQEQLAERLGCATTFISRIENGRRSPSLANIGRLAEILDVPVAALFDWD